MKFIDRISKIKVPEINKGEFYLLDTRNIQSSEEEARILNQKTLQRADRFVLEEDRNRFIHTQAALRFFLSNFLSLEPSQIPIIRNKYGKPFLKNKKIKFNISHTKSFSILGFHPKKEIGIDIENVRDISEYTEIAEKFMHLKEIEQLESSSSPLNYFFSTWCLKEAFLKSKNMRFDHLKHYCLSPQIRLKGKFLIERSNYYIYLNHDAILSHKLAICLQKK